MEGTLRLTLVEGKNLAVRDSNGKSDPWVKFRLGSQKLNSSVKWRTLAPFWNETFTFVVNRYVLRLLRFLLVPNMWEFDERRRAETAQSRSRRPSTATAAPATRSSASQCTDDAEITCIVFFALRYSCSA